MARQRREKGAGSIYKRGNSYIAQMKYECPQTGKLKTKQVYRKTQSEAVAELKILQASLLAGKAPTTGKTHTVSSWIDLWLEDHIKPNREVKTYQFYKLMADKRIKPYLGIMELNKVTPTDVSRMFKSIEKDKATPNTIAAVRRTLRAAYGVAMKYGHVNDNPVSKTFATKVKREPKVYFDADQVKKLLEALKGSPIENLVKFTLATGMRIGEVTGITWDSVDLKQKTVLVRNQLQRINKELVLKPLKTEKSVRTMPLVGHSLDAVESEKLRQGAIQDVNTLNLVFTNPWGRPFDPKYVNDQLHDALEKAKLPKTGMHSLRHSAATFMLMAGLNLHQVSRYLGHSQIALTSNLYGHVLDGAMRSAALQLQAEYQASQAD